MSYASTKINRLGHDREVVMLYGGAASWTSKMQEVVALFTTKAEYVAVNRV
jgi:hypothetical protein